jgi:hypothetical protein
MTSVTSGPLPSESFLIDNSLLITLSFNAVYPVIWTVSLNTEKRQFLVLNNPFTEDCVSYSDIIGT